MKVHVLFGGFPLCQFSGVLPGEWPDGNKWVGKDEIGDATCERCIAIAEGRTPPEWPIIKIFTVAHVPEPLQQPWLQHLRDFDIAYPGCHFEVGIDAPDEPLGEMVQRLVVNPDLSFTRIYERTKWKPGDDALQKLPKLRR